jgi:hypothetical protein
LSNRGDVGRWELGDLKLTIAAWAGDDFSGVFFLSGHAELAVWALEFHKMVISGLICMMNLLKSRKSVR